MSNGKFPILTDYDLGERVNEIFFMGGNVVANVPGVGMFILTAGGGVSYPLLAPNGTVAAPSFSFAAAPSTGLWRDPGVPGTVLQGVGGAAQLTLNDSGALTLANVGGAFLGFTAAGAATLFAAAGQSLTLTGPVNASLIAGVNASLAVGAFSFALSATGELLIGGSAGVAGQVPRSAGPGAPAVWATPATVVGSTVSWGAANIDSGVNTRIIPPGYIDGLVNTDTPRGFAAPRAGTLRNLFARHQLANGNGNAVTYTVRVNGVLSALTVNLATGAVGQASNLANSVAVAQGDLIELAAIKTVAIGSGVQNCVISAQFN